MALEHSAQDPLEFVRGMWSRMGFSLPGMVTPTLDVGELEKRIANMRAVEGWLKMNLSMLQMAIQGLDMQRAALAAVQAMSKPLGNSENATEDSETTAAQGNPFLWPWNAMGASTAAKTDAASAADDDKAHAKRKASAK
ncbi:MAG: hypothetical protein LBP86_10025 [Azoarcus sp.]|jgi:hypothetical protein|nr:hypothetical protein [Azoarcus sp.]